MDTGDAGMVNSVNLSKAVVFKMWKVTIVALKTLLGL